MKPYRCIKTFTSILSHKCFFEGDLIGVEDYALHITYYERDNFEFIEL
jgi:hypothetical protein